MGSMGKLAKRARTLLAAVLAAALAMALVPGTGMAASTSAEGPAAFDARTGQQTTSVYVKARTELFDIADHTKVATEADLGAGIWVQVANGAAPFTPSWHSVQVDDDGNAIAGTEREWGAGEPAGADASVLYLKPAAAQLQADSTYHFWCEVTDSSQPPLTASNEDDPIVVLNAKGYGPNPKEWFDYAEGSEPKPDHWTWRVEGGMVDDAGQPNGVDGKIANPTILSGSVLGEGVAADRFADAAAAADRRVDVAYNLALTNAPAGKDAFVGTLLVKLDVTDLLAGEGAPSPDELGLLWLNPYEPGGVLVPITAAAPYQMAISTEDGRTIVSFRFPAGSAGQSGSFGSFAVTSPVPPEQMCTVSISTTGAGYVDPYGIIERPRGSQPQIRLYPEFGNEAEVVALGASGEEVAAPGTLAGDTFTLDPLSGDVALRVKFTPVEVPDPGTEEAWRTLKLVVGAADADRASYVYVVGDEGSKVAAGEEKAGIRVDASEPVTLGFNTAQGFAVGTVRIEYAPDDVIELTSIEGAYKELPVLRADATVTVSYRTAVTDPAVRSYETSAVAIPARAADAAASSATGSADTAVTFSAVPKLGWQLTGAQVVYVLHPQGGAAEELRGRSYAPDELDAGSLTLYGITAETRVEFSFDKIEKSVFFPDAAGIPGVAQISMEGTRWLDIDSDLVFTITLEAGYTMPPSGLMLIGSEGEGGLGWQGSPVQNADGTTTYQVRITFADVADLGDGAKLSIMPKRQPTGGDGEEEGPFTVTTHAGAGGRITAPTTEAAGATVTIWFFPDEGKELARVLIDGVSITDPAFDISEELYDHTADERPFITLRGLAADHLVEAVFADGPAGEKPPSVIIKPDPGDLPIDPDADPDRPTYGEGDSNVEGGTPVYKGETQSFTYVPRAGWEFDGVKVDGEFIYFDGAHLKDDPAFADHELFAWDEQRSCYVFKGSEGETVEFDPATGTLTFRNVQSAHTYLFVATPVLDVVVNVDATGGTVHANGAVDGSTKSFTWKMRKGLPIYMIPDTAHSYALGQVKLDGTVVAAEDIHTVSDADVSSQGTPPLSALVRELTQTERAYAAEPVVYAFTIPSSYLRAKQPGETVSVTVPFVKNGGSNGGDGSGNGDGNGSGGVAPGISNGFNGDTAGDGSAQNPDGTFTITAKVRSGRGALDCAGEQHVRPGADCTVAFKPAVGYQVVALHIDGTRYAYTNRTFTFRNVQAGHTVQAEFAVVGYAGDNSTIQRAVKTLQALAQTGDLNAPAATALLAVAFGAMGVAALVWSRRREEDDRAA